jgi:hypothetical protein
MDITTLVDDKDYLYLPPPDDGRLKIAKEYGIIFFKKELFILF